MARDKQQEWRVKSGKVVVDGKVYRRGDTIPTETAAAEWEAIKDTLEPIVELPVTPPSPPEISKEEKEK